MAGKQDGTGGADSDAANAVGGGPDWLARMICGLEQQAETNLADMAAVPRPAADDTPATAMAAVDRKARAITNLARAVRAITAMRPQPEPKIATRCAARDHEDSMSDDDADDVDPAEFERAQQELGRGLDRLRRTIETKRMEGWPLVQADAGSHPGDEDPGPPADP